MKWYKAILCHYHCFSKMQSTAFYHVLVLINIYEMQHENYYHPQWVREYL